MLEKRCIQPRVFVVVPAFIVPVADCVPVISTFPSMVITPLVSLIFPPAIEVIECCCAVFKVPVIVVADKELRGVVAPICPPLLAFKYPETIQLPPVVAVDAPMVVTPVKAVMSFWEDVLMVP